MRAALRMQRLPALVAALLTTAALLAAGVLLLRDTPAAGTPRFTLWGWQRTEDFSFIDPAQTRLALLAATIDVTGDHWQLVPRRNPVTYPDGTALVAVVRLEVSGVPAAATAAQLAAAIVEAGAPFQPVEYQLDFDATLSQRAFYHMLLQQLRQRLSGQTLSITALASWCFHDDWISALPIDRAVAMLYRMGSEGATLRRRLTAERQFPATICRHTAGYSSDEALLWLPDLQDVFLYAPTPWTAQHYEDFKDALLALATD